MAQVIVRVLADLSKFTDDIGGLKKQLKGFGKGMSDIGASMSLAITAPLVGVGVAAAAASGEINKGMANVATLLPNATDRVLELKAGVQDLSIQMGTGTKDMSEGLYELISTFGDSNETLKILDINARAAKAGLATTEEAIGLTAAVTKGYNDTTAEAVQHAADLGFVAVNLGKTTFPELAASIGKVVPMAAALGVTQEELFAQLAALTGVTGDTAEVTTGLRAVYQAILKPTGEMTKAISEVATGLDAQGKLVEGPLVDAWHQAQAVQEASVSRFQAQTAQLQAMEKAGLKNSAAYKALAADTKELKTTLKPLEKAVEDAAGALGSTIVQSVGVNDAITRLNDTFEGNTLQSGKAWSSVEALTQVLALSGSQADSYAEKYAAMGDAVGTTDQAFKDQTETVNKNGFEMEKLQAKVEVMMQRLGDGLGPAISIVIDKLNPFIDMLTGAADGFSKLDPEQQTAIVSILAVAAAIGPLILIVGQLIVGFAGLITAWGTIAAAAPVIGAAFTVLLGPVGLVILAVAALVAGIVILWNTNEDFRNFIIDAWTNIRNFGQAVWELLGAAVEQFGTDLLLLLGPVGVVAKFIIDNFEEIKTTVGGAIDYVKTAISGLITYIATLAGPMLESAKGIGKALLDGIVAGMPGGPLQAKMRELLSGAVAAGVDEIEAGSPSKKTAREIGKPMAQGVIDGFMEELQSNKSNFGAALSKTTAGLASSLAQGFQLGTPAAGKQIANALEKVVTELEKSGVENWRQLGDELAGAIHDAILAKTPEAKAAAMDMISEISDTIEEAIKAQHSAIAGFTKSLADTTALASARATFGAGAPAAMSFVDTLTTDLDKNGEKFHKDLSTFVAGLEKDQVSGWHDLGIALEEAAFQALSTKSEADIAAFNALLAEAAQQSVATLEAAKKPARTAMEHFWSAATEFTRNDSQIQAFGTQGAAAVSSLFTAMEAETDKAAGPIASKGSTAIENMVAEATRRGVIGAHESGGEIMDAWAKAFESKAPDDIQHLQDLIGDLWARTEAIDPNKIKLSADSFSASYAQALAAQGNLDRFGSAGVALMDAALSAVGQGGAKNIEKFASTAATLAGEWKKNLKPEEATQAVSELMAAVKAVTEGGGSEAIEALDAVIARYQKHTNDFKPGESLEAWSKQILDKVTSVKSRITDAMTAFGAAVRTGNKEAAKNAQADAQTLAEGVVSTLIDKLGPEKGRKAIEPFMTAFQNAILDGSEPSIQAFIDMLTELEKQYGLHLDKLKAQATGSPDQNAYGGGAGGTDISHAVSSAKQVLPSLGIKAMAAGAVALGPTLGMFGEAGKEATMPLSYLNSMIQEAARAGADHGAQAASNATSSGPAFKVEMHNPHFYGTGGPKEFVRQINQVATENTRNRLAAQGD